ncbi:hypothetical protein [Candidatus Binatus sp.]|uniref:hypothetical protein n=1 Tax=Candidatus Binatus sp. TaxID=2811406 RepID=UPI00272B39D9|nr:hypothetical protein [Candidatus Binatus sp.]
MRQSATFAGMVGLIAALLCGLTFSHRARVEIGRRQLRYLKVRKLTGLAGAAGISIFAVSFPWRVTASSERLSKESAYTAWCMVVPPLVVRSGVTYMKANLDAPLDQWQIEKGPDGTPIVYISNELCEKSRAPLAKTAIDTLRKAPKDMEQTPSRMDTLQWTFSLEMANAKCIETNDPRLGRDTPRL